MYNTFNMEQKIKMIKEPYTQIIPINTKEDDAYYLQVAEELS